MPPRRRLTADQELDLARRIERGDLDATRPRAAAALGLEIAQLRQIELHAFKKLEALPHTQSLSDAA